MQDVTVGTQRLAWGQQVSGAMGCCQDKDTAEISVPRARPLKREGPAAGSSRFKSDEDSPGRRSEDSFLITVLWRRLSLFSRRSSARSSVRHSQVIQRQGDPIPKDKHEDIQEQLEKG